MTTKGQTGWFCWRFPIMVVLAVIVQSKDSAALVTDFTWTPTAPVMGQLVTYTAVNNGQHAISSHKWEYTFPSCGHGIGVTDPSIGNSFSAYETRPGTWQIRLTVTYIGNPVNPIPPPPTVITKNVVIAPPRPTLSSPRA